MSSNRNDVILSTQQKELINQFLYQHFSDVFAIFPSNSPLEIIMELMEVAELSSENEILDHLNDLSEFLLQNQHVIKNKEVKNNSYAHIGNTLEERKISKTQSRSTEERVTYFKEILEQDFSKMIKLHKKGLTQDAYGTLLLFSILLNDDTELTNCLLANIENINEKHNGCTFAQVAAEKGRDKTIKLLIEQGANIDEAHPVFLMTALHIAAQNGHLAVVRVLLEHNANTELKNNDNCSATHLAASRGHVEIVKLLLEYGANIEEKNQSGGTPLLFAAENGHTEVIRFLLEQGANIKAKCKRGRTGLHFASLKGHTEALKLFIEQGAEVDGREKTGWTALRLAARYGKAESAKILIENGANISLLREESQSPYISFMQALGYPINSSGLCHGLSHMAKQAILLDDISLFNQRLFSIRKAYFDAKVGTKTKKGFFNWFHHRRVKNSVKRKIRENFYAQRNKEREDKTLPQTTVNDLAFLDGVFTYQLSFSIFKPIQQTDNESFLLVNPVNLEEKQPIAIDSFTGNYINKEELKAYFDCLGRGMEEEGLTSPVAFIISTPSHSMTIGYNPSRKTWLFFDANSAFIRETASTEMMADEIERGFGTPAIFSTTVNVLSEDAEKWDRCMQGLKKGNANWQKQWQDLHAVTPEKVRAKNKRFGLLHSHDWKDVAVKYGDPDTVSAICDKQNFIRRNIRTIMASAYGGAVAGLIAAATTFVPGFLFAPFLIPLIPVIVAGGAIMGGLAGAIAGVGIAGLFTNRREVTVARRNQVVIKNQLKTERESASKKEKRLGKEVKNDQPDFKVQVKKDKGKERDSVSEEDRKCTTSPPLFTSEESTNDEKKSTRFSGPTSSSS